VATLVAALAALTLVLPAYARDEGDSNKQSDQQNTQMQQQRSDRAQEQYDRAYASDYDYASDDYGTDDYFSSDSDAYQSSRRAQRDRNPWSEDQDNRQDRGANADLDRWVRVAYDYDNDGSYDAVEYLLVYDLNQARNASHERQREMQRRSRGSGNTRDRGYAQSSNSDWQNMKWRQHATGERGSHGAKRYRMRGNLEDFRTVRLNGVRKPHLVAKLRTDGGRKVCVDLGPRQKVQDNIDLDDGDSVTVYGVRGSINDHRMLIAQRVDAGGQSYDIQRQRGVALRRYNGRIIDTEDMRLRGDGNREHVVATVRLDDNTTKKIALGTKSKIDNMDIGSGDEISVLASACRMDGEPGLVARSIRVNGETHSVNRQIASRR